MISIQSREGRITQSKADEKRKRKEKEKIIPFGVSLMRSQVLYQAAQAR